MGCRSSWSATERGRSIRMELRGKKVIALGERDGVPGPAVAECASRAGAEGVLTLTACYVGTAAGAMGLEDQAAVKRVADEHGSGVVVLLGTPDAESTQTLAQTVVAGDPSYAGPLAGVPLGLPVFHVFEPEVRDQVPGDVYEAQVALMEMSLDRDAILTGLREARRAGATTSP